MNSLHNGTYCCTFYKLQRCVLLFINIMSCVVQLGFALLALIWEFDFPPFMVLIIAILNDGKCPLMTS